MDKEERRKRLRDYAREQIASREEMTLKIHLSKDEILKLLDEADYQHMTVNELVTLAIMNFLSEESR